MQMDKYKMLQKQTQRMRERETFQDVSSVINRVNGDAVTEETEGTITLR